MSDIWLICFKSSDIKCQFLTFKVNFLSESFSLVFIDEYQVRGMFFVVDMFFENNHAYFSIAWYREDVEYLPVCYTHTSMCSGQSVQKILTTFSRNNEEFQKMYCIFKIPIVLSEIVYLLITYLYYKFEIWRLKIIPLEPEKLPLEVGLPWEVKPRGGPTFWP